MDILYSDALLMAVVYFMVWFGAYIALKSFSSRMQFEKGDGEFKEAIEVWLKDGCLVQSDATRQELQNELERFVARYVCHKRVLMIDQPDFLQ